MLGAYHRAFASELRAMVESLPIREGQTVLDMACGDGVYAPMLADRVGALGRVVAVDLLPAYLDLARKEAEKSSVAKIIEFTAAPIEALPFDDGTFDFVWCAQSFYSLPDPVEALRHLVRVTKPGGIVAVLEGDTLHHVILPWPVEVELTIRAAELKALTEESDKPRKFYVGRQLRGVFRKAGLIDIEAHTWATDRAFPLSDDERTYFTEYLKEVAGRVGDDLKAGPIRDTFHRLINPSSREFMLDDPDLMVTCIDQVVWGRTEPAFGGFVS